MAGQRAHAFRRRRQVLSSLVLLTGAGVAPALLLGGPWAAAVAVPGTLLVAYLGLLVRRGRREVERSQKVRYLTPIRAPRPSVVVIGSGAARLGGDASASSGNVCDVPRRPDSPLAASSSST